MLRYAKACKDIRWVKSGNTVSTPKRSVLELMKKSYLIAVITVLAAVAGALGAVAVYLHRREKELDEYERLLFGEDDAVTVEETAEDAGETAPAEDAAE